MDFFFFQLHLILALGDVLFFHCIQIVCYGNHMRKLDKLNSNRISHVLCPLQSSILSACCLKLTSLQRNLEHIKKLGKNSPRFNIKH